MSRRLPVLVIGLFLFAGCGSKSDKEAIQDVWKVVSSEEGGHSPTDPRKKSLCLVDAEVGLFTLYADESPTRLTFKMKIDPAKSPKQIDLDWDGLVQPGIYELKGDDLKICYDQAGKTRPADYKTSAGDKVLLLVLKRKKI
jgi:uncharacterized protein (TIGR03067 family)